MYVGFKSFCMRWFGWFKDMGRRKAFIQEPKYILARVK